MQQIVMLDGQVDTTELITKGKGETDEKSLRGPKYDEMLAQESIQ